MGNAARGDDPHAVPSRTRTTSGPSRAGASRCRPGSPPGLSSAFSLRTTPERAAGTSSLSVGVQISCWRRASYDHRVDTRSVVFESATDAEVGLRRPDRRSPADGRDGRRRDRQEAVEIHHEPVGRFVEELRTVRSIVSVNESSMPTTPTSTVIAAAMPSAVSTLRRGVRSTFLNGIWSSDPPGSGMRANADTRVGARAPVRIARAV